MLFLVFFAEFELLRFHNNIVKMSEKLSKQNFLKICLQVTYLKDYYIISTMGKVKIFIYFF